MVEIGLYDLPVFIWSQVKNKNNYRDLLSIQNYEFGPNYPLFYESNFKFYTSMIPSVCLTRDLNCIIILFFHSMIYELEYSLTCSAFKLIHLILQITIHVISTIVL